MDGEKIEYTTFEHKLTRLEEEAKTAILIAFNNKIVGLIAEAEEGYRFANWTGDVGTVGDVEAAITIIIIGDNYSITANFIPRITQVAAGGFDGGHTVGLL